MKLLSFKKPIKFEGQNIVINDLARNHKYKKENQHLIVEGESDNRKIYYKAFYNQKGEFEFVKMYKHQHLWVMVSWKQEYDIHTVEKMDKEGNSILIRSKYLSTSTDEQKLIEKSFHSRIGNENHQKVFKLVNNQWTSEGDFPKKHFQHWL